MNKHQIDQFWNKGFVVVESVVHKELIEEANRVLRSLIEAQGKIKRHHLRSERSTQRSSSQCSANQRPSFSRSNL